MSHPYSFTRFASKSRLMTICDVALNTPSTTLPVYVVNIGRPPANLASFIRISPLLTSEVQCFPTGRPIP